MTAVALASPLLTRLADGAPDDPVPAPLGEEAVRLEAELRDLIRAPRLAQDRVLTRETRLARQRGVAVVLLDDSASTPTPARTSAALPDDLVRAAGHVLTRSGPGDRVVIRLCPPHARQVATVHSTGPDGVSELHGIEDTSGGGSCAPR